MKIAFIGQKGIPVITGGVERRVQELSIRMVKQGHEVFVYARRNYTDISVKQYKGVKLVHIPTIARKNLDTIVHTFFSTVHAIFQHYDVIHFQAPGPSTLAWLIRLFRPDVILVATFNSQDYKHQKWNWLARKYLQLGEWAICKFPNQTIVISDILKKYAQEKYKIKTVTIPNGSAVKKTKKTNLLKQWGIKKNKYIFYLGRIIKHKGLHYLVEAVQELKKEGKIDKSIKVVITGEGAYTNEYVKELKTKANSTDIIFTGAQTGEAQYQLYSHALMFVQPSEAEGLSNSLLEAMGYGLPIVVSDIVENIMVVGNTALMFKKGDVEDLKRVIVELVNNTNKSKRLGKLAKRRVWKKYDWDKVTEMNLAVYRKVFETKKRIHKLVGKVIS